MEARHQTQNIRLAQQLRDTTSAGVILGTGRQPCQSGDKRVCVLPREEQCAAAGGEPSRSSGAGRTHQEGGKPTHAEGLEAGGREGQPGRSRLDGGAGKARAECTCFRPELRSPCKQAEFRHDTPTKSDELQRLYGCTVRRRKFITALAQAEGATTEWPLRVDSRHAARTLLLNRQDISRHGAVLQIDGNTECGI